jgi:putative ABC transport system permease protein
MFTTVKERTFEIGLQKALGAKRWFILMQFLTESVLLCLLGGLFGLAFTWLFGQVIELILQQAEINLKVVMSTFSVVFSICISASIGLLSGFIPSILAARLDPVDSMRK